MGALPIHLGGAPTQGACGLIPGRKGGSRQARRSPSTRGCARAAWSGTEALSGAQVAETMSMAQRWFDPARASASVASYRQHFVAIEPTHRLVIHRWSSRRRTARITRGRNAARSGELSNPRAQPSWRSCALPSSHDPFPTRPFSTWRFRGLSLRVRVRGALLAWRVPSGASPTASGHGMRGRSRREIGNGGGNLRV